MYGDSRESMLFRPNSLRTVGCPEVDSRILVPMANVVQSDIVPPRGGRIQPGFSSGDHVFPDCMTVTGRSGR